MNEEHKKQYLEKYTQEKQKGVKFWPDIIYKDLVVTFAIFLLLVSLATFMGVAGEPKADPSDANYVPRPEWYFLWLFEFLKYFPGQLEWVGVVVIPGLLVGALLLLPFYDRSPFRYWKKRIFGIGMMSSIVLAIVALTVMAVRSTPPQEEETAIAGSIGEQVILGQDLYAIHCAECHGADGDVTVIEGVEGLDGAFVSPISHKDVIYTRTDETLFNVIAYGQQDLGMPPFSSAYGGPLSPAEVEYIVTYMRYTWDDRVELPEEAAQAGAIPTLAPGEIPTWEKHIQPIFKRYCDSCHRPGKTNNNYITLTYDEAINSGDNGPAIYPGDLDSLLLRLIHREEIRDVAGPMPPSKALPENLVAMIEAWVLAGAPETADDAGKTVATAAPTATAETLAAPLVNTPLPTTTATVTATPSITATPTLPPTATSQGTGTTTVEAPTATEAPAPSATSTPQEQPYP
ncbi:MAG: c-type cytochrome [Chloroflexota bacterium]